MGMTIAAQSSPDDIVPLETWLFLLNFFIMCSNSLVMPVREAMILKGGKELATQLMLWSTISSTLGTWLYASISSRYGGHFTLQMLFATSLVVCLGSWAVLGRGADAAAADQGGNYAVQSLFYLYFTFFNMTSMSTFWVIAGDILGAATSNQQHGKKRSFVGSFGKFAAGGTLGQLLGSMLSTYLSQALGTTNSLLCLSGSFLFTASNMQVILNRYPALPASPPRALLWCEIRENLGVCANILQDDLLRYGFLFQMLLSLTLGLFTIERSNVARRTSMATDDYASLIASATILQGVVQFTLQYLGSERIVAAWGRFSVALSAVGRLMLFTCVLGLQSRWHYGASSWYFSGISTVPIIALLIGDISCRILNQTASKPLKESMWTYVPPSYKYRAKIIIDVFAHRCGTSAAALLSSAPMLAPYDAHIGWGFLISLVYVDVALQLGILIDGQSRNSKRVEKKTS